METINSNKTLKNFLHNEFNIYRKNGPKANYVSKYFGEVGSTLTEDIPYDMQLAVKKKALMKIFQSTIPEPLLQTLTIQPSPQIYEYRFRMDFVASFNPTIPNPSRFGQRRAKRFNQVVDMTENELVDKIWFEKTRQLYERLNSLGIQNYDLKKYTGDLRYLVLRVAQDQAMVNIVTKTQENSELIKAVADFGLTLGFKSINWIYQPKITDITEGDLIESFGSSTITIKLGAINFEVGANSFFQNNINGFELILDYVKETLVSQNYHKLYPTLIDLYCGVGTISLNFATLFKQIVGYDINEENILLANRNSKTNNIKNASYEHKDVNEITKISAQNSVLVVDPPRTGLETKGVNLVVQSQAPVVIYISCNPITQMFDMEVLKKYYAVKFIRAFDLFPHTYHMENVIVLERS